MNVRVNQIKHEGESEGEAGEGGGNNDAGLKNALEREVWAYQRKHGGIKEIDVINLWRVSRNDAKKTPSKTSSVYFYVPEDQPNIVTSDFTRPRQSLWSGVSGHSRVTIRAKNAEGEAHNVVLRIEKRFRDKWLKMNDGVRRGYGQVRVSYLLEDNLALPPGHYTSNFIIIGAGWHDSNYRVAVKSVVNFSVASPETIKLRQLSVNYATKTPSGDSSVYFFVPNHQPNIVASDFTRPRQSLWSGVSGHSRVTVRTKNAEGEAHNVVLRIEKRFRDKWLKMNDGVRRGYGQVRVTFKPKDNPKLPPGYYATDFVIVGAGWHNPIRYRVAINSDVDIWHKTTPEDYIRRLMAYVENKAGPVPTIYSYAAVGISGVTAANLADVNAAIAKLTANDVATTGKIQTVVDTVKHLAHNSAQTADWRLEVTPAGVTGGTATLRITYSGTAPVNVRNAVFTIKSPSAITSPSGQPVDGSTRVPALSSQTVKGGVGYTTLITWGLDDSASVDHRLDAGQSLEISFKPDAVVERVDFAMTRIELPEEAAYGADMEALLITHDSPVDLRIKGWDTCLTIGTVTTSKLDINSALAESGVGAIFKDAGIDGVGDRGMIQAAGTTQATIDQARAVERQNSSGRVVPVMVVRTADVSGSSQAVGREDIAEGDNLYKHFVNLIRIAKTLQAATDEQHPNPGSILLNPDLPGAWQQRPSQFDDAFKNADGSYKTVAIRVRLQQAIDYIVASDGGGTTAPIPDDITDDLLGWVQSQNFIVRHFAPDVTFGWQMNLWAPGTALWVHQRYASRSRLRDQISSQITDNLDTLNVYGGAWKPDFIAFDKHSHDGLSKTARDAGYTFNSLDWEVYLEYVRQITTHVQRPAMLWQIPGGHIADRDQGATQNAVDRHAATAGTYFMGDTAIGNQLNRVLPRILSLPLPESIYGQGHNTVGNYLAEGSGHDWGRPRLGAAANANVFAILFGGADAISVVDTGTNGHDGDWLKNKVINYYRQGCTRIGKEP